MTDLLITAVGDATVRSLRPSLNDGTGQWVRVKSGEMRGLLLPELPNIADRTVLSATLTGRVGPGHVAQTYTLSPITERWSPGRVTWTNSPAINSGAQVTEVVSALADGGLVEVDVSAMIQAVADGTEWFGIRITTNSTATEQRFYSSDSGNPAWELAIVLSDAPEQPSNLRPDGGAVGTSEPILAWSFIDLGGDSTEQADSQVQVDTPAAGVEPDGTAPDFNSGWVTNPDPQYDLAAATYTPPGSPPGPTYWRVRVRDGAGVISEWSDWADFTVTALPTLVVDSPTGAFGDVSPTVTAHLSSGTVSSWKAYATGPDRSDLRAESGVQTGAVDWEVPARNKDGRRVLTEGDPGWIYLRVYDSVDRAVAVGEATYRDVWIEADLTEDGALTAPTGLTVTAIESGHPQHTWSWSRTEDADAWLIQVDGATVERLDPEDVTANAGTYTWTDYGHIPPLRTHTLKVRAVEGADVSTGPSLAKAVSVDGVWLLPEDGDPIKLGGNGVGDFSRVDRVATYAPLVGPELDIIYDTSLRSGTFAGGIDSRHGDVWAALDKINTLAASRRRTARMVWGSESILVRLADLDATPDDGLQPGNLRHRVRFRFVQVGE